MVGACADWFAVTALFRRPFGLPIPHTAIIPRNKDRIGRALGDFIGGELLTPRLMAQRLSAFAPAERLASWLTAPGRVEALAPRLAALAPDLAPSGDMLKGVATDLAARLARGPAARLSPGSCATCGRSRPRAACSTARSPGSPMWWPSARRNFASR